MKKDIFYPIRVAHGHLYEFQHNILPWVRLRLKNPNAVFLILIPEHRNLGDHAIAIAERELLEESGITFIEVTDRQARELLQNKALNVFNGRTVLIHGGGNLGTLWFSVEKMTREIIIQNPRSSILLMPNTIFYENSDWGKEERDESVQIYNKHRKLRIFARELTSYDSMRQLYKDVELVPDMALRLDRSESQTERKGCLLCLRADIERTRTDMADNIIKETAATIFGTAVTERDMIVPHAVPLDQREAELEKQFSLFHQAELVITDRLHGMIFAAITGTPCIVIDSKSPKVKGCYEWIKELDYIQFCEDPGQIEEIWRQMPKGNQRYPIENLLPLYAPLEQALKTAAKRK